MFDTDLAHSLHIMHNPKIKCLVDLIMSLTHLGWRRLLSVDLFIADNSCEYLQLCTCILQQSQLSHYPERKINEFRQHIEELETEYKRFLKKLRSLDPTCKHKPWEPRAYAKRRQDPVSNQNICQFILL